MLETPAIIQTTEQQVARIHIVVRRDEIQKVMGPGLAELGVVLAKQKIDPTGPWFTHHLKFDPGMFDYEICFPVAARVADSGRVTSGVLPAMTAARTIYRGGYEGLGAAWHEFDAWIRSQGRTPAVDLLEAYLTDPSSNPDPASWRTELTRPLAG